MSLFGLGRKNKVVDLSEQYKRHQEKTSQIKEEMSNSNKQDYDSTSKPGFESVEEKRRKITKKFSEMIIKIEELSTQVYHLQQRIELLEKKLDVKRE